MDEFEKELISAGATKYESDLQCGVENKDAISFELNGKIFIIESGRGGDVVGGSYLSLCVLDAK